MITPKHIMVDFYIMLGSYVSRSEQNIQTLITEGSARRYIMLGAYMTLGSWMMVGVYILLGSYLIVGGYMVLGSKEA